VAVAVVDVVQHEMALAETCPLGVLARQADRGARYHQRRKRERLGVRHSIPSADVSESRRASSCLSSLGCTAKPSGTASSSPFTSSVRRLGGGSWLGVHSRA